MSFASFFVIMPSMPTLLQKGFLIGAFLFSFHLSSLANANNDTQTSEAKEHPLKKNVDFTSNFAMRGASYNEGPDDAQFVQLVFNPTITFNFNKYFKLHADTSVNLVSARQQTRFDSPSLNSINLNEALFSLTSTEQIRLSLGAINQKHLDAPMLAQSDLAFIGLIGSYKKVFKNLTLTAKAQYTVPNSTSLESDRTGEEELPTFQTQGLEALWTPLKWVKLEANVNYFSYSNLPSIIAYNSGRFGNEVVGATPSESFFAHDFRGFSQSYTLGLDLQKPVKPFLKLQSVDNLDAPRERERSQILSLGLDWHFKSFSVTPMLSSFYTESDAAPSAYTDARFGRNNRDGQSYGLKFHLKKLGLSIQTTYVNADLIEPDPVQNDVEYFEVYVEVANVKF